VILQANALSPPPKKDTTVRARVPADLAAALDRLAEESGSSVSHVMRSLLAAGIASLAQKPGTARVEIAPAPHPKPMPAPVKPSAITAQMKAAGRYAQVLDMRKSGLKTKYIAVVLGVKPARARQIIVQAEQWERNREAEIGRLRVEGAKL